jgi:hypothetical protein
VKVSKRSDAICLVCCIALGVMGVLGVLIYVSGESGTDDRVRSMEPRVSESIWLLSSLGLLSYEFSCS